MASKAAATAAKALYAEQVFVPKGPINAGRFNLLREIYIGTGLGLVAGMTWKVRRGTRGVGSGARATLRERERGRREGPSVGGDVADAARLPAPRSLLHQTPPHTLTKRKNQTSTPSNNNTNMKQMYHWDEKRKIATYYKELAEKEAAEEAAHDAVVAGKMAALRAELLK